MRVAGADPLYTDPELAGLHDPDNGDRSDLDFCARLAAEACAVLDLDRLADPLFRQPHVAALLTRAGLAANRWLGDWEGHPFAPDRGHPARPPG